MGGYAAIHEVTHKTFMKMGRHYVYAVGVIDGLLLTDSKNQVLEK